MPTPQDPINEEFENLKKLTSRNNSSYVYTDHDIELLNTIRNQETNFHYLEDETRILVDEDDLHCVSEDGKMVVEMPPCDSDIEGKNVKNRLSTLMASLEKYHGVVQGAKISPTKIFFPYKSGDSQGHWNAAVIDFEYSETEKKYVITGSFYSALHEGGFDEKIQDDIKDFFTTKYGVCKYEFSIKNHLGLTKSNTESAIYVSRILNRLKANGVGNENIDTSDIQALRDVDSEIVAVFALLSEKGFDDKTFTGETLKVADDLISHSIVRKFQRISSKTDRDKILEVLKNANENPNKKNSLLDDLKAISESASNLFIKSFLNGNNITQELRFEGEELEFIYNCCENVNAKVPEVWIDKAPLMTEMKEKSVLSDIAKIVEETVAKMKEEVDTSGQESDAEMKKKEKEEEEKKTIYEEIHDQLKKVRDHREKDPKIAREDMYSILDMSANNAAVPRAIKEILSCDIIEEEFNDFFRLLSMELKTAIEIKPEELLFRENLSLVFNNYVKTLKNTVPIGKYSEDDFAKMVQQCHEEAELNLKKTAGQLTSAKKESLFRTFSLVTADFMRNYAMEVDLQKAIVGPVKHENSPEFTENNRSPSESPGIEDDMSILSDFDIDEDKPLFQESSSPDANAANNNDNLGNDGSASKSGDNSKEDDLTSTSGESSEKGGHFSENDGEGSVKPEPKTFPVQGYLQINDSQLLDYKDTESRAADSVESPISVDNDSKQEGSHENEENSFEFSDDSLNNKTQPAPTVPASPRDNDSENGSSSESVTTKSTSENSSTGASFLNDSSKLPGESKIPNQNNMSFVLPEGSFGPGETSPIGGNSQHDFTDNDDNSFDTDNEEMSEYDEGEELKVDKGAYRREMMAYYWSGKNQEQLDQAKASYAEKRISGTQLEQEAVEEINKITLKDLEKYNVNGEKITSSDQLRQFGIRDKDTLLAESKIRAAQIPAATIKSAHLVDFRTSQSQGNNRN